MIEPLLLTTARLATYDGDQRRSGATGFFFEREGRLYLVTSRHVAIDEPSGHRPSRLTVELHDDPDNLAHALDWSVPLYDDEAVPLWRQGLDAGGEVDVAVVRLDREAMPEGVLLHAFTPEHLQDSFDEVEVGSSLLVVGFPLGFHDTLHHLPVVRQAAIASSFGLRFQGQGYFLTDARTHRGISGAPVVLRMQGEAAEGAGLPWKLLGVHSARLDMSGRDLQHDETLGLNCAWYADILLALTSDPPPPPPSVTPLPVAVPAPAAAPAATSAPGPVPAPVPAPAPAVTAAAPALPAATPAEAPPAPVPATPLGT